MLKEFNTTNSSNKSYKNIYNHNKISSCKNHMENQNNFINMFTIRNSSLAMGKSMKENAREGKGME